MGVFQPAADRTNSSRARRYLLELALRPLELGLALRSWFSPARFPFPSLKLETVLDLNVSSKMKHIAAYMLLASGGNVRPHPFLPLPSPSGFPLNLARRHHLFPAVVDFCCSSTLR